MKFSIFVGTSLDGFIARVNGELDFLPHDGGEDHGYREFMASVDGIVVGRKTFETVLTFNYWPYGDHPVVVLTSTPDRFSAPRGSRCEFLNGDPSVIAAHLKTKGLNRIYVDGGLTIQRFLEAGLIDDLTITHVPVLIGGGIPLFGFLSHDVRLKHVATRSYPSGLVTSEYLVLNG